MPVAPINTKCYSAGKENSPARGICMKGNIYTSQKCPICGGPFVHVPMKRGLFCRKHPESRASAGFKVQVGNRKHGTGVSRGASSYEEAERILNGIRWEVDQKTFDPRDHRRDDPLAFDGLAHKWLSVKEREVKKKSLNNLQNYMNRAIGEWKSRNIKTVGFAEIEDFLLAQQVSDKTRVNIRSALNSFWAWLRRRKVLQLDQIPEIPEMTAELGYRNIITKEQQEAVVEEVRRLTYEFNPRIWLGIKWLATYFSIRPGVMFRLTEGQIQIDGDYGRIVIPKNKQKDPQIVPLLPEDIKIINGLPKGMPTMRFFRHGHGVSGVEAGEPFGEKYFYKWWKKACANLGITDVDLYGGTKHSSVTALRREFSPEKIQRAAQIKTNAAFDRYLRAEAEDGLEIFAQSRPKSGAEKEKKGKLMNGRFRGK